MASILYFNAGYYTASRRLPDRALNEVDRMNALRAGLQDQLGLKLERTRSTVETLTIEHVERPSAN
jgi:uncharacterized protein (TIGR03435 family)